MWLCLNTHCSIHAAVAGISVNVGFYCVNVLSCAAVGTSDQLYQYVQGSSDTPPQSCDVVRPQTYVNFLLLLILISPLLI